jgi:hypothetical protein
MRVKRIFLILLKDITKIIETMSRDDFVKYIENVENHLNEIDEIKNTYGMNT